MHYKIFDKIFVIFICFSLVWKNQENSVFNYLVKMTAFDLVAITAIHVTLLTFLHKMILYKLLN